MKSNSEILDMSLDAIKIIVALRMARAAVGWSQDELAKKTGLAKTTIARIETGEAKLSAEAYFKFTRLYGEQGLEFRILTGNHVTVAVNEGALKTARARLADVGLRRSDRKKTTPQATHVIVEGEDQDEG